MHFTTADEWRAWLQANHAAEKEVWLTFYKYVLRYTPRRKGSNWSERNKKRVAELIEQGRMTEAGLVKIDEAEQSGRWDKAGS